ERENDAPSTMLDPPSMSRLVGVAVDGVLTPCDVRDTLGACHAVFDDALVTRCGCVPDGPWRGQGRGRMRALGRSARWTEGGDAKWRLRAGFRAMVAAPAGHRIHVHRRA